MEKALNIISIEYLEVKKNSRRMKMVSYVLMMVFILNPLSEFIDVFRKTSYVCWCQLPCLDPFYFYNFL